MSDSLDTNENVRLLHEVKQLRLKIDHAMFVGDSVKLRQHVEDLTTAVQNWQAALSKETP